MNLWRGLRHNLGDRTLRDVVWSSLPSVVAKARGLVLIPIIIGLAGIAEYGAYVIVTTIASYGALLGTLSLNNAMIRMAHSEASPQARFVSLLVIVMPIAFILTVILAIAAGVLSSLFLDGEFIDILLVGSGYVAISVLRLMAEDYYRSADLISSHARIQAALPVLEVLSVALGLLLLESLAAGMVLYVTLGGVLTLWLTARIVRGTWFVGFKQVFQWAGLRKYLAYSIPLVPSGLTTLIASNGDRLVIGWLLDTSAVGIYSTGYAIGSVVMMANPPITNALFPKVAKAYSESRFADARQLVAQWTRRFGMLALLLLPLFGLTWVFFGRATGATDVVAIATIVLFATGIYGCGRIYSLHLFGAAKTNYVMYIYVAGAVLNVGLNLLLIPSIGTIGAALSTLIAYTLISGAIWGAVRAIHGREDFGRVPTPPQV